MINYLKKNSINKEAYDKLPEDKRKDKIVVGKLYKDQRLEYVEAYDKIIESF